MTWFQRLADWFRYQRLHHYPVLAGVDRDVAMARLRAADRAERRACRPAIWLVGGVVAAAGSVALAMRVAGRQPFWSSVLIGLPSLASLMMQVALYHRVRSRLAAMLAAERQDGRLWQCMDCGYDLRASPDRCPECGAAVRVEPPQPAAGTGMLPCTDR
ncbi:MAG: hypothetical protein JWO31_3405 [Phycisphaerales bacterium]|nr:hypothetical protein [Phycisphaerales bacterium]